MPLKLQKGIPIPSKNAGPRSEIGEMYRKMKVGESFDVAADSISRPNLYQLALYSKIKVTVRTIVDEKTAEKIYRVWRIE